MKRWGLAAVYQGRSRANLATNLYPRFQMCVAATAPKIGAIITTQTRPYAWLALTNASLPKTSVPMVTSVLLEAMFQCLAKSTEKVDDKWYLHVQCVQISATTNRCVTPTNATLPMSLGSRATSIKKLSLPPRTVAQFVNGSFSV